jgi:hypothetical protein
MKSAFATSSNRTVLTLRTLYPKQFGSAIFLSNCLAALSAGPVWIAEVFVIGGNMFAFVGLFLPIFSICLIVGAFFAWSKKYIMGLAIAVVSALVLLFTVVVLNAEHHAPHDQELSPLQVTYFLLVPLLIQLLNATLSIYKLHLLRLSE